MAKTVNIPIITYSDSDAPRAWRLCPNGLKCHSERMGRIATRCFSLSRDFSPSRKIAQSLIATEPFSGGMLAMLFIFHAEPIDHRLQGGAFSNQTGKLLVANLNGSSQEKLRVLILLDTRKSHW